LPELRAISWGLIRRGYPATLKTGAQRALYNNLGQDAVLALAVDAAIRGSLQNDWKTSAIKTKKVRIAIRDDLEQALNAAQAASPLGVQEAGAPYSLEAQATRLLELAKHQNDY